MTPRRDSERGAALLVVMVAVAVLTILAGQLAYDTQVSLRIAANARDELRATYLAKSGVNLSRLVLSFQQKIDQKMSMPGQQGMGTGRIQLWRLVPVGSGLASGLFGAGEAGPQGGRAPPAASGGGAAGAAEAVEGFQATIDDEAQKVNAQLDAVSPVAGLMGAQVEALFRVVCDSRWDALFDREDEHGVRVTRQDLLVYLRDWIDPDERGSALLASFPAGGCSIIVPPNPFEDGFQDENSAYDRGPDRYRAKNARMDSLDELYMIAGIGDPFLAAFGNQLTVYLPAEAKRTIPPTNKAVLVQLAEFVADPSAGQAVHDAKFAELLHQEAVKRSFDGMISMTPPEFAAILVSLGIPVNQTRLANLTDRSPVFGVKAEGKAGAVSKVLDVVVRVDDTQQVPSPNFGRLVHWREE